MMFPPVLLRVHIKNQRHNIRFWLPLFIVGIPATILIIAVALLLLPFALLAGLVMLFIGHGKWVAITGIILLRGGPRLLAVLCALRGLTVDVGGKNEKVFVSFQ